MLAVSRASMSTSNPLVVVTDQMQSRSASQIEVSANKFLDSRAYEPKSPNKKGRNNIRSFPKSPQIPNGAVFLSPSPYNSPPISPTVSNNPSPRQTPSSRQSPSAAKPNTKVPVPPSLIVTQKHDATPPLPAKSDPSSPKNLVPPAHRQHRRRASDGEALFAKQKQFQSPSDFDEPRKSMPVVVPISQLGSLSSRIASKSFWNFGMLVEREKESETSDTKLPSIDNRSNTVPNSPETSPPVIKKKGLKHSTSDIFLEAEGMKGLYEKQWSKPELPVNIPPAKTKRRVSLHHLPPMRKSVSQEQLRKTNGSLPISPPALFTVDPHEEENDEHLF
ncbi:PREDICTED: uncharacterized protein LOC109583209 [Amphimedon queenslandica]|uniref:Uncharacterized protein n=1 Tax=Amphimedon queenslandica TaxID=400682 RepID=A0A1X7UIV8_AMPQE|nr:PREDICTED: uncharacterized protein LOC109583209 [Amphimedon queenslandica]|eukprot:XP_019854015.1 PREDICTED: uncharacterized protein LOC109583209 [Amphimedon queenslandica]